MSKKKLFTLENIIFSVLLLVLAVLEYRVHKAVVFINDDIWYSTNLVTGEKLHSLKDIWESQYWHFFNWGGRSINHAVLQLVIMSGETSANILNMVMQFLLAFMICKCAKAKSYVTYALSFAALIVFNPEPILSMFWESGSVNYLYSTTWLFVFAWVYMREMETEKPAKLALIELWIIPLAIMSGWSNENTGPAVFMLSLGVILWNKFYLKRNIPIWMYEGCVLSFVSFIPMIIAPGNSVRSEYSSVTLLSRIENIVNATVVYLFPVLVFTVFLFMLYTMVYKKKLSPANYAILIYAVLSHGAMFMSPMYPSRPAFGVMAALMIVDASMLDEIMKVGDKVRKMLAIMSGCIVALGIITLIGFNILPPM